MQGVFNPNIPIFPPNSAEGLHFCFSFIVPVVVKSYFMFFAHVYCNPHMFASLSSRKLHEERCALTKETSNIGCNDLDLPCGTANHSHAKMGGYQMLYECFSLIEKEVKL